VSNGAEELRGPEGAFVIHLGGCVNIPSQKVILQFGANDQANDEDTPDFGPKLKGTTFA